MELRYSPKTAGLTKRAGELAPDELLLFVDERSLITPISTRAEFEPRPEFAVGRQNNTAGVKFGVVHTLEESGAPVVDEPVAIKPLGPAWKAVEEVRIADAINELGSDGFPDVASSQTTFDHVGIYRAENGNFCAVSKFEPDVVSFDNVLWVPERPTEQRAAQALAYAAATLIYMHANGYVHMDYQAKNTASDGRFARIIDVTSVKNRKNNFKDYAHNFTYDLDLYVSSVLSRRALNGVAPELIESYFVEPYLDCIEDIYPPSIAGTMEYNVSNVVAKATKSV